MKVDREKAVRGEHGGYAVYLCSEGCREKFDGESARATSGSSDVQSQAPRPSASRARPSATRAPTSPRSTTSTLEVAAGEICVLVGPSGCGKTTAMRMVNRMVELSEGDVLVGGESVRDREPARLRREIGYVIQQIGLFPHRTVAQNIGAVPQLLGWKKDRIRGPQRRAAGAGRARPRARRPLPGAALRRPAAAGRGGAGAGRRPAGDADGRAVRGDRPDQPRAAAERVPAAAGGDPQDRPLRHPRHRRGDQDGRPDRDPARGRPGRPVRDPGRDPDGRPPTSSSRTSSAPTGR